MTQRSARRTRACSSDTRRSALRMTHGSSIASTVASCVPRRELHAEPGAKRHAWAAGAGVALARAWQRLGARTMESDASQSLRHRPDRFASRERSA